MQVLIDYRKDLPIIENVRYLLGISYFSYNMPEVYELNELAEIVKQLKNKNNVVIVNLEKIMYEINYHTPYYQEVSLLKESHHYAN